MLRTTLCSPKLWINSIAAKPMVEHWSCYGQECNLLPAFKVRYGRLFIKRLKAACAAEQSGPFRETAPYSGAAMNKGFTGLMAHCRHLRSPICRAGKNRKLKEIGELWRASPNGCRPSIRRPCSHVLSTDHSYLQHHDWRSIHIGGHIQFVPIDWPVRWRPAAEHPRIGDGNLGRTEKVDYH